METHKFKEHVIICRVPKEESAYLYHYLELHSGLCAFHTIETGKTTCDIRMFVPTSQLEALLGLLDEICSESPLKYWEIPFPESLEDLLPQKVGA